MVVVLFLGGNMTDLIVSSELSELKLKRETKAIADFCLWFKGYLSSFNQVATCFAK